MASEKTPFLRFDQKLVGEGGLPSPFTIILIRVLNALIARTGGQTGGPFALPVLTVAELQALTATAGLVAYCSDETGGATLAFGDGTNWRRVQDRVVIS